MVYLWTDFVDAYEYVQDQTDVYHPDNIYLDGENSCWAKRVLKELRKSEEIGDQINLNNKGNQEFLNSINRR